MWLLLIAFIVVPVVELAVIIKVGQWIGLWPTLFLLLASAVLGTMLLRSQGRAVWERFNKALAERRAPHREVFDGAMVIVGGTLLLTPGFITDIFGMLLLIPPSRNAIRGLSGKLFFGRYLFAGKAAGWSYNRVRDRRGGAANGAGPGAPPPPGGAPPRRPRPSRAFDVEGTAQEIRDESLIEPPPPSTDPER